MEDQYILEALLEDFLPKKSTKKKEKRNEPLDLPKLATLNQIPQLEPLRTKEILLMVQKSGDHHL